MAHLEWATELATGIERLDKQHQSLVAAINQLEDAILAGDRATIGVILDKLPTYVADHFGDEEAMMSRYEFPGLAVHRKEHKSFVRRVMGFHRAARDGDLLVAQEMLAFLQTWAVDHIKVSDAAYGRFFAGREIRWD